ncbi:MAG: Crp/Fnr family transcriptional regulator [Bacteroidota bacterium]
MDSIRQFFSLISPLSEESWSEIGPLFVQRPLPSESFFVEEHAYAREIAYLETGCVRAFFTNQTGKEYNKQFFVGPSLIGAYTSLLTGKPNKIPQQALTDCVIWAANYDALTQYFDRFHDLERLARKIAEHYFLEKEAKELEMALQDATERYLHFREQFPRLEQLIPQYHIASYLSISATQLSRIRHKLRETSS